MNSAKNQFGKQQSASRSKRGEATAKLGTASGPTGRDANRRTHNAKPKTQNPKQETYDPRGPKSLFLFSVSSSEFSEFTSLSSGQPAVLSQPVWDQFACGDVRALCNANKTHDTEPETQFVRAPLKANNSNSKPTRKEIQQLWPIVVCHPFIRTYSAISQYVRCT